MTPVTASPAPRTAAGPPRTAAPVSAARCAGVSRHKSESVPAAFANISICGMLPKTLPTANEAGCVSCAVFICRSRSAANFLASPNCASAFLRISSAISVLPGVRYMFPSGRNEFASCTEASSAALSAPEAFVAARLAASTGSK